MSSLRNNSSPHSVPLFGRTEELEILTRALAEAQAGRGHLVTLVGEAGIGKTRLASELIHSAAEVAHCFIGRAYAAEGRLPYGIWIDALDSQVNAPDPATVPMRSGGASAAARLLSRSRQVSSGTHLVRASEPGLNRGQMFGRFLEFVGSLAEESPIAMLLDDVHFADQAAIELLHFLTRHVQNLRVLLLATYCPEGLSKSFDLAGCLASLERQSLLTEIQVGPLRPDDSAAIVRHFFHDGSLTERVVQHLYALTTGNPLLLDSLLKHLRSIGSDPATWDLAFPDVPKSISQLITQRTMSLTEDAQEMLSISAVAGETGTFGVLKTAAGIDDARLLAALDELRLAQILCEDVKAGVVRYRFCHPVIRESIYRGLGQARRAYLHALIGDAIALQVSVGVAPSELARHFVAASSIGTQHRALPHLVAAGEHALAVFANHDAAEELTTALELLTPEDPREDHLKVRELLGEAHTRLGQFSEAIRLWQSALQYAEAPQEVAALRHRIGRALWQTGNEERAIDQLGTGLASLDKGAPSVQAADLHQEMAQVQQRMGNSRRAIAEAHHALELAEPLGVVEIAARAHVVLASTLGCKCYVTQAVEHGRRALALAAEHNLPVVSWRAHYILGALYRSWGDYSKAEEHLVSALNTARQLHLQPLESWPLSILAEAWCSTGQWERALEAGEEAVRIDRMLGQGEILPRSLSNCALLYRLRGDRVRADGYLAEAYATQDSLAKREPRIVVALKGTRAFFQLLDGDIAGARATAEDLLRSVKAHGNLAIYVLNPFALPLLAQSCILLDDISAAEAHVRRLRMMADRFQHRPALASALHLGGLLRAVHGDQVGAVKDIQESAATWQKLRHPYNEARTVVTLAEVCLKSGAHDEAADALHLACVLLQQLGADEDVADCQRLLSLNGPRHVASAAQHNDLNVTPSELEVMKLVALGRTNREIADRLVISPLTAKTHVQNILQKLGVQSRVQVAVIAARHGLVARSSAQEDEQSATRPSHPRDESFYIRPAPSQAANLYHYVEYGYVKDSVGDSEGPRRPCRRRR